MRGLLLLALLAAPALADPAEPPQLAAGSFDVGNPFTAVIAGKSKLPIIYEDAAVIAYINPHPAALGAVVIVSKTSRARNLLEIAPADLSAIMAVAAKIGRAQLLALPIDGFSVQQNNGSAQSVFQYHVHVIPRMKGVQISTGEHPDADPAELARVAALIRAKL